MRSRKVVGASPTSLRNIQRSESVHEGSRTIRRALTFTISYNAAAILMPASSLVSFAIVFASHRR